MGKAAKGSRKGKKAWRANISTADIEDYLDKASRDHSLSSLPDHSLFFSHPDPSPSPSLPSPSSRQRKTHLHRLKPLRHEAPLLRKSLPSSASSASRSSSKKRKPISIPPPSASPPPSDSDLCDLWQTRDRQPIQKRRKLPSPSPSPIPPVEIEPLGCSFNPPFEPHQDALAKAVADEMQKLYHKELQPDPVPLTVPGQLPISEEDKFFLDASQDDDDDDRDAGDAHDSNTLQLPPKPNPKKLTRVQLNRRARRKELLRAQADANRIQTLSKEIDSLPHIIKEIEKEDEEKEKRHTRRLIAKQERLKTAPPRLGKSKFVPPPVQVLLTEEITGSLRKLKGCCTLARDRFKSLEKRALIVPRSNKRSRNYD